MTISTKADDQSESRPNYWRPSVAELRAKGQVPKTQFDQRLSYRFFRFFSVYLTWLAVRLRLSPNAVTAASLLVAGSGLVCLTIREIQPLALGLLLLYHLLDRVDGELARYYERYSITGIYLDNVGHFATFGLTLPLFAFGAFAASEQTNSDLALLFIGILGGAAASLSRTAKLAGYQLYAQYVIDSPDLVTTAKVANHGLTRSATRLARGDMATSRSLASVAKNALLAWTQYPALLLFLTIAIASEELGRSSISKVLLVVASGLSIIGWLGVEAVNLSGNLGAEIRDLEHKSNSRSIDGDI